MTSIVEYQSSGKNRNNYFLFSLREEAYLSAEDLPNVVMNFFI